MAILHYNNDYVNSPAVDPNAFVSCPFGFLLLLQFPFLLLLLLLVLLSFSRPVSSCFVSFFHFAVAYLLAFYLLWFHFERALVVVDSFEDNL